MTEEKDYLTFLAKQNMLERGLSPEYSDDEINQLAAIKKPALASSDSKDLRSFLWCSIDNDDSLDLDQLTFAQDERDGSATIWVAIADVDALIKKNTPIDLHARTNTTSVYTPSKIFAMLPEKLSTNLTSLNENEDRLAMVVEINIDSKGMPKAGQVYEALVRNKAKLTYNAIGAWLKGSIPLPDKVKQVSGLKEALECHHNIAQRLRKNRHERGALTLRTREVEAKVLNDDEIALKVTEDNFAHQIIEEFMIAANSLIASHFRQAKVPSLRRVVKTPKRWEQIVALAAEYNEKLPEEPNSKALENFLIKRKNADPENFADLSLTVIKLLGRGEYVVANIEGKPIGHFGLDLEDYTHATAPNRRFPDLLAQRQYKALLKNEKNPYSISELNQLAEHCTNQEDAANKVERQTKKSAAALLLQSQIGSVFQGIVTGKNDKGTWVRVNHPPVEGKIVKNFERLKVGDKVSIKLVYVDVARGFIDFAAI